MAAVTERQQVTPFKGLSVSPPTLTNSATEVGQNLVVSGVAPVIVCPQAVATMTAVVCHGVAEKITCSSNAAVTLAVEQAREA